MSSNFELFLNKGLYTKETYSDEAIKNIRGGIEALLSIMSSTLGPKGAFKIINGNKNIVTNDGATILGNLHINSPSARILMDSSKSQDFEEGDGTTSVVILSALILKYAYESRANRVSIIRGLSLASEKAESILNSMKFPATKENVRSLIKTTLNSKIFSEFLDKFVDICIEAIDSLDDDCDLNLINFIKVEGDMHESFLSDGFIMENVMHTNFKDTEEEEEILEKPKILLVNTDLGFDKIKIAAGKIQVNSIERLVELEQAEKMRMKNKIDQMTSDEFDLLINRRLLYDYPLGLFIQKGKSVIENIGFDNLERLQKLLGCNVYSYFNSDDQVNNKSSVEENAEEVEMPKPTGRTITTVDEVRTIFIKDKKFTKISGIKKGARTIVLFGSSNSVLDEMERSIHDAFCVLKRIKKEPFCLYGAGNTETVLSILISKFSDEIKTNLFEGPRILSQALMEFVEILCTNCGHVFEDFRSSIVSAFNSKKDGDRKGFSLGLNKETGETVDVKELGVIEGFSMKLSVISSAIEASLCILKCDGIIQHPLRERERC